MGFPALCLKNKHKRYAEGLGCLCHLDVNFTTVDALLYERH